MDRILARLETLENVAESKEVRELCEILTEYINAKNEKAIGFETGKNEKTNISK